MTKITYSMSWKSYLAQEYSQTKWDTVTYVTVQTWFEKKNHQKCLFFATIIQTVNVSYGL